MIATSQNCSTILNAEQHRLVCTAFQSLCTDTDTLVPMTEMVKVFNSVEHPRVKEGIMAPSAARDTLFYHFGACAKEHNGYITLDEFIRYHEKLVDEAYEERVQDVNTFITTTIMQLWRLGDLLLPTGIRPSIDVCEIPSALYAVTLMTLVWPEREVCSGEVVLKGVKDVVRPIFARGQLPEDLQGFFAFPEELTGMNVHYLPTQISIQRWMDFVWEYESGKFAGVQGIISARVDLEVLPQHIRQFVIEHSEAVRRQTVFVPTSSSVNPMYKRSSENYGSGVDAECRRVHAWKVNTLAGKQYGQQYHGLCSGVFSKLRGPVQSNAATGINL